jgi:hypothetical protein
MRFPLILGLLVSVTAVPAIAEAQPRRYYYRDDPRHDGLLFRLNAGLGGQAVDDRYNDTTLSGGAAMISLDLGGAIAPNLALHGRFSRNSIFEPDVSSDGADFGELDDTSLTFTLLGLGLTYYLPSNLYLTGVIGLSRASFEFEGDEYDAYTGAGIMGDLGYEWAIGRDWGLGLAGRLELHTVRGNGEELSAAALGVLLSLTYF